MGYMQDAELGLPWEGKPIESVLADCQAQNARLLQRVAALENELRTVQILADETEHMRLDSDRARDALIGERDALRKALTDQCDLCAAGHVFEDGSETDYDPEYPRHYFQIQFQFDGKPTTQMIWRECKLTASGRDALRTPTTTPDSATQ